MILKRCNKPGCVEYIPRNQTPPYCTAHQRQRNREYDKTREPHIVAFYRSAKWRKLRSMILAASNNMCVPCLERGELTHADTVHHLIEVREDWSKRLERSNCIAVCRACHEAFHKRGFANNK